MGGTAARYEGALPTMLCGTWCASHGSRAGHLRAVLHNVLASDAVHITVCPRHSLKTKFKFSLRPPSFASLMPSLQSSVMSSGSHLQAIRVAHSCGRRYCQTLDLDSAAP